MFMKKKNFLDYIPYYIEETRFQKESEGVCIYIKNKGFYNKMAQILFQTPKQSELKLIGIGGYVWQKIDGKRSVYEIGQCLKEEYAEEAEPLYERLVLFLQCLYRQGVVKFHKKM